RAAQPLPPRPAGPLRRPDHRLVPRRQRHPRRGRGHGRSLGAVQGPGRGPVLVHVRGHLPRGVVREQLMPLRLPCLLGPLSPGGVLPTVHSSGGWPPPAPTGPHRRECQHKVDTLSFCHLTGASPHPAAIAPPPIANAEPGEMTAEMSAVTPP